MRCGSVMTTPCNTIRPILHGMFMNVRLHLDVETSSVLAAEAAGRDRQEERELK